MLYSVEIMKLLTKRAYALSSYALTCAAPTTWHTCIYVYICIYIYTERERERERFMATTSALFWLICLRAAAHAGGGKTGTRPVFKSSIWKNGPSPWESWTFEGHVEVKISNHRSEIWDPQSKVLRIEILRTDCVRTGLLSLTPSLWDLF